MIFGHNSLFIHKVLIKSSFTFSDTYHIRPSINMSIGSKDNQVISKHFLENALDKRVESFSIKQRADTGDNFLSILYTLDVTVLSDDMGSKKNFSTETLHFICKCFPKNAGRQEFLNETGVFWKELDFYKIWVPELHKFIEDLGLKGTINLNFPTFIAGNAIRSENGSGKEANDNNNEMKIIDPFENYVMMVDLCRSYGFKLPDRLVRLDKDHLILVVEALAKIHALSWAYKTNKKIDAIKEKFPSMVFDYEQSRATFEGMMNSVLDEATEVLQSNAEISSEMLAGLVHFKESGNGNEVMEDLFGESTEPEAEIEKYFRVKPTEAPESTEIPWKVVIHGDCHMTNMLFRYNSETNQPEEVVLVDMQLARETSPVIDLIYFMYTSTFVETRKKHCDEILRLYYEKFNHYCMVFKTEPLPGFTLKELTRRYQRSKVFGFLMAIMIAPIMLKDKEDAVQMDSLEGLSQEEILKSVAKGMNKNIIQNIISVIKEAYDDGII